MEWLLVSNVFDLFVLAWDDDCIFDGFEMSLFAQLGICLRDSWDHFQFQV
jgi:hypothetical protein